jgi:hypothetical protein
MSISPTTIWRTSTIWGTSTMTARIDGKLGGAGFSLRGTLVPVVRWRTEVRRRLKSAPQEFYAAIELGSWPMACLVRYDGKVMCSR